jgi:hypothetical protein
MIRGEKIKELLAIIIVIEKEWKFIKRKNI